MEIQLEIEKAKLIKRKEWEEKEKDKNIIEQILNNDNEGDTNERILHESSEN